MGHLEVDPDRLLLPTEPLRQQQQQASDAPLEIQEQALDALVRVLRLNSDQREYVESLARRSERRTPARRSAKPVRPQLQRLLDQLTDTPALVFGRYLDILAWNDLASALITDFGAMPATKRNYVRMVFTDPAMRELSSPWPDPTCCFHNKPKLSRTDRAHSHGRIAR